MSQDPMQLSDIITPEVNKELAEHRVNSLVQSIARQRDAANTSVARLEAELAVQAEVVKKLMVQIHVMQAFLESSAAANADLKEQLVSVTSQLTATQVELNESESEQALLRQRIVELEAQLG